MWEDELGKVVIKPSEGKYDRQGMDKGMMEQSKCSLVVVC